MTDDRIREILTSPLEEKERRRKGAERTDDVLAPATGGLGPWLLGAVVTGGALALVGYLVAGGNDDPVPTSLAPSATAATSTSTTAAPQQTGALPEGYTEVGIHGVRVERILLRPDAVFVTVSSVLPSGLDPETSAGFQGGRWVMELADGTAISSLEQSIDGTAPGFISIRFPVDGVSPSPQDVVAVRLTGLGVLSSERLEGRTEIVVAPGETTSAQIQPSSFALDEGVTLELTALEATSDDIRMEWSLSGSADAVAALSPLLEITSGDQTVGVGPVGQGGGFGFFPSLAGEPATASGQFTFSGPESIDLVPEDATEPVALSVRVELPIAWTIYHPIDVSLPLDGVPTAVAG